MNILGYDRVSLGSFCENAELIAGMKSYFAQRDIVKANDSVENRLERGYRNANSFKELFMVRGLSLPPLLQPAIAVWRHGDFVVHHALKAIACDLQLPEHAFASLVSRCPTNSNSLSASVLRLLHYRAQAGFGAEPHTDVGLLTYLPPSSVPALQVQDPRCEKWHDVEHYGNGIIMVGESLAALTQRAYVPCMHRVLGVNKSRFAVALQVRVNDSAIINTRTLGLPDEISVTGVDFTRQMRSHFASVNGTSSCTKTLS